MVETTLGMVSQEMDFPSGKASMKFLNCKLFPIKMCSNSHGILG